jgi:hypothetical protein
VFVNDPNEIRLGAYRESTQGGFSHRWVAYILEKKDIELNGQTLGPYTNLSRLFRFSQDGEHIAFAAERDGQWRIVLDGKERWTYPSIGFADFHWYPQLKADLGMLFGSSSKTGRAALLEFSDDGSQLAYQVKSGDGKWSVVVDGNPGVEFEGLSDQMDYCAGHITYTAFTGERNLKAWNDKLFGPYDTTLMTALSPDKEHWCSAARKDHDFFVLADGRESRVKGFPDWVGIGRTGKVGYIIQAQGGTKVYFSGRELPCQYVKVLNPTISPDGEHIAFWAKKGERWSVVTDTKTFSGFDGCYYHYYRPKNETVSILWSKDSKNIAYFALEGDEAIVALNGKKVPSVSGKPGVSEGEIKDDAGKKIGANLLVSSEIDPDGYVQCLLSLDTTHCIPRTSVLINGKVAYMESSEKGEYVVVGGERMGPYQTASHLIVSEDRRHFALVVKSPSGEQVLLDGVLSQRVYEEVLRPTFVRSTEFAHLGLKNGSLYSARYPLPQ